jgi:FkbM family methyltransferase
MKFRFLSGEPAHVQIRPDWLVACHPICVPEFTVFLNDAEQRAELNFFVHYCQPKMQLLDAGAHWGVFTLAAFRYGGSGTNCVCVEPSPAAARVLMVNLSANRVERDTSIVRAAAGDRDGTASMLTTGAGGADYFVVPSEVRPDTVEVPQVELTGLCRRLEFNPTHVKIDVEGFEKEVLLGARELLEECKPILFLELHGDLIRARGNDPEDVLHLLTQIGYSRWEEAGKLTNLAALKRDKFNNRFVCLPD